MAYYKQRKPKRLDYRVLSEIHIVSPHARNMPEKWKYATAAQSWKTPRSCYSGSSTRARNRLDKKDFVSGEAVEIQYKSNPAIHVGALGTSFNVPTDNWGELTHESKVLRVLPYLLNPGQYIDIQMLFERSPDEITVEARFADQESPMQELGANSSRERERVGVKVAVLAAAAVTIMLAGITFGYAVLTGSSSQP